MNNDMIYPKTIEYLLKKIDFYMKNEQNIDKINELEKWLLWFNKIDYKLKYILEDNEYLKEYIDKDKYCLQIWKHTKIVDVIRFNLICNGYDDYNNEITEITN